MNFSDTNLAQNYSKYLFEEKNYDLAPEHAHKIFDVIFSGTSDILKQIKNQKVSGAVQFTNIAGNFIAAGIISYIENEDPNMPGSWNLSWTFNKEDINDSMYVINFNDDKAIGSFVSFAASKYSFRFKDNTALVNLSISALELLKKWLDDNAKTDEEVSIELPEVFKARVAVENGEKVFALEPDGMIKKEIKDDAAIEK